MNDIYYVWNSLGWIEGLVFLICLMGLYYYKSWVDWHFKNKNFNPITKKKIKVEQKYHHELPKSGRSWD